MRVVLAGAARPAVHSIDELLGGGSLPATAIATSGGGAAEAGGPTNQGAGPETALGPVRPSDVAADALVGLARHRRLLGVVGCLLLICAAAVSAMPVMSAAGSPEQTPASSLANGLETSGTQPPASDMGGDQAADLGDVSIYNVVQPVDAAPGATGFQVYVVRGGDTLSKIGAKFGLSYLSVYWANTSRLPDPSALRIGQKLVIPPADGVTVTVKANDTLSGFASTYHVSTRAIMTANGLTSTNVTVGQLLLIPVAPPALPTPKPGCGASCGSTVWHGGKLRWPVPASHTITQYFSSRHPAIDIGAPMGTPVVAAASGTVIWAGWKYSGGGVGGGIEIWINHGGKLYTTYNHLSKVYVKVGQTVAAGQHIGNVGMTGNATGPHLHFEVWVCYPWSNGTTSCARNPLNYF
jgi:murein DD-endopeptidase MepM/ murein hydrolase activator NlpD